MNNNSITTDGRPLDGEGTRQNYDDAPLIDMATDNDDEQQKDDETIDVANQHPRGSFFATVAYQILRARVDQFPFTPTPRFHKGSQTSVFSFVGSIVLLGFTLGYAVMSFQDFLDPVPRVTSSASEDPAMTATLPSFSFAVVHSAENMNPYSMRPLLSFDRSYFSVKAAAVSVAWTVTPRYWDLNRDNYRPLTLHRCDQNIRPTRRLNSIQGWCPESPDGVCPATKLCLDDRELSGNAAQLSRSCRSENNCTRIEIVMDICRPPVPLGPVPTAVPVLRPPTPYPLPAAWDIKLITFDGESDFGRVALRPAGNVSAPYGIICNDFLDNRFAQLVCRAVGRPSTYARLLNRGEFPPCDPATDCHFYIDDWICDQNTTNPLNINDCRYLFYPEGVKQRNCGTYEQIGVVCPRKTPSVEFKLVNTSASKPRIGLLMMKFNSDESTSSTSTTTANEEEEASWSSLCRREITEADATAICREMGHNVTKGKISRQGEYGTTTTGLMYGVYERRPQCHNSSSFTQCVVLSSGDELVKECRYNDIALDCSMIYHDTQWEYKLVNTEADPITGEARPPAVPGRGLFLVKPPGEVHWGGVCTVDFSGIEAAAACRSLDFPAESARVFRVKTNTSIFRPDTMYVEDANCAMNATYFDQCSMKVFPYSATLTDEHSYDCGGLSGTSYFIHQRFRLYMCSLVILDCNEPCAERADITGVLNNAFMETSVDLPRISSPPMKSTRRVKLASMIQYRRETFFSKRYVRSNPDYWRRFQTETSSVLEIKDELMSVAGGFDLSSRVVTGNTAAPPAESASEETTTAVEMGVVATIPPVFTDIYAMDSVSITESRQFDSILDVVGSINALYGAIFMVMCWVFLRFNSTRFYKKNPLWQGFRGDFTNPAMAGRDRKASISYCSDSPTELKTITATCSPTKE